MKSLTTISIILLALFGCQQKQPSFSLIIEPQSVSTNEEWILNYKVTSTFPENYYISYEFTVEKLNANNEWAEVNLSGQFFFDAQLITINKNNSFSDVLYKDNFEPQLSVGTYRITKFVLDIDNNIIQELNVEFEVQ